MTTETPEAMVRYDRDGAVGVITLDRPPVNAYDDAFHFAFQAAWKVARADDSRAVVLLANGRHFCVGANLRDPQPAPDGAELLDPPEEIRLIASVTKPTIAAVQGGCIGGGQRMVWPCDLVFCTEDAFFMDPTAIDGHRRDPVPPPHLVLRPAPREGDDLQRHAASGDAAVRDGKRQSAVSRRRCPARGGARVRARDLASNPTPPCARRSAPSTPPWTSWASTT